MKPACQQCTKAKKADGCEYDDGKGKTRTQILRETIVKLEHRIRELEDPEYVSTSVTLYDPNLHSRSNSSSSSLGSPESSYISVSHSPFPSGSWPQFIDFNRAHCHIDSSPPPRPWSQTQVGLSHQISLNRRDLPCFARSACPLLHRHPLFLRLSLMIIEHNHQWCLHKYCIFFFFSDV